MHRPGCSLSRTGEERMRGTIRQLGLEGGLWALITDDGRTVELVDPPPAICKNGLRVAIAPSRERAEVSVGMLGDAVRVASFDILDAD